MNSDAHLDGQACKPSHLLKPATTAFAKAIAASAPVDAHVAAAMAKYASRSSSPSQHVRRGAAIGEVEEGVEHFD
jgi:hypothetical protein